jgi:hypothetical protein
VSGAGTENVRGLAVGDNGTVYAAGLYQGDTYLFDRDVAAYGQQGTDYITKLQPNGAPLWTVTIGGEGQKTGPEIVANDDGVTVSSLAQGQLDIGLNFVPVDTHTPPNEALTAYLIGFDNNGSKRFAYSPEPVGSQSSVNGNALALSPDGRFLSQSYRYRHQARFGETTLTRPENFTDVDSAVAFFTLP